MKTLITLDCWLYWCICLGNAPKHQTASAAAYRCEQAGLFWGMFWRPVIDTLFFLEPQHCQKRYEYEMRNPQ